MSKKVHLLEEALTDCQRFLELVPLSQIAKGIQWHPSEEAIQLGMRAKESINRFVEGHHHPMSNS